MRQRARPRDRLLFYENEVEDRLCLIRETGIVCVAPVPERFADTVGMRSRRAFNRSARKLGAFGPAMLPSATRYTHGHHGNHHQENVNKINFIPQSPTELAARRCNPGRGDRP